MVKFVTRKTVQEGSQLQGLRQRNSGVLQDWEAGRGRLQVQGQKPLRDVWERRGGGGGGGRGRDQGVPREHRGGRGWEAGAAVRGYRRPSSHHLLAEEWPASKFSPRFIIQDPASCQTCYKLSQPQFGIFLHLSEFLCECNDVIVIDNTTWNQHSIHTIWVPFWLSVLHW